MSKPDKIGVAVLAAGLGKRIGKKVAKPLVPLMGLRLVDYPLMAAINFARTNEVESKFGIVVGHQKEEVQNYVENRGYSDMSFPVQEEQLGTADALKSYYEGCSWAKDTDYTMVLCADTPLLTETELNQLWKTLKNNNWDAIAATFNVENPFGYGRIIRSEKGFSIVEEKDATADQRKIEEVNSGLYIAKTSYVLEQLYGIDSNNEAGEFYLTDIFKFGLNVGVDCFSDASGFLGVNNPVQLEEALTVLKAKINRYHQENGVHILDSQNTYIESSVTIEKGTTIYPGCFLHGNTKIGSECMIEPGSIIKNSIIASESDIRAYSYLEEAIVHDKCSIGPYARLRPGTDIGKGSKIGNFVEIKKAKLGEKVGVSHLSYVGDAEIGENVNIGCGFITCNYDGAEKHLTKIGKNSFIGSDTQMIAPVEIGESAFVASGSTINQNVPDQGFAIARGRQVTKEKMATKFLRGKWSIKKS